MKELSLKRLERSFIVRKDTARLKVYHEVVKNCYGWQSLCGIWQNLY